MAISDYGAIVKINGKIVNKNDFFMDMDKAVGWIDYPTHLYEDCTHVDENDCSDCISCPLLQKKYNSKLKKEDLFDCKGKPFIPIVNPDNQYMAYAGDEDFTVGVYKNCFVIKNKNSNFYISGWSLCIYDEPYEATYYNMVRYIKVNTKNETVNIKIKKLVSNSNQLLMTFKYNGNFYQILYGYGIDSNKRIWDAIKYSHCSKKVIRIVDRFFETEKK